MHLSLLPSVREAAYRRKFVDNFEEKLFMDSFDSFAAAEAGAPPSKAVGCDDAPAEAFYSHPVAFYAYPGLFRLGRGLDDGMRSIFDLGGHVGIKYYAFRRVLNCPADLHWTVCDVPSVVKADRERAVQREATAQLNFTTDFKDASGYAVLYALSSLQYLPQRISEIIAALPVKPRRIVLNSTAVHPDRTLYTLHSRFGVAPYRVQHHDELLDELSEAGYKQRDGWRNEGKSIQLPFVDGGRQGLLRRRLLRPL